MPNVILSGGIAKNPYKRHIAEGIEMLRLRGICAFACPRSAQHDKSSLLLKTKTEEDNAEVKLHTH